ncbi:nuclear transport factor 2 family protein [soil metagenome]
MSPVDTVQRQLDAYNALDLDRFVAQYTDDVQVFQPPSTEPFLSGKAAFAAHYANNRFTRPELQAELINRMVVGDVVVDQERISGLDGGVREAIAVYRVVDGLISTVWFY